MLNNNNNTYKCLVVDDEPMARDVLKRYIQKIPGLDLIGECSNAIDASIFLQNVTVDLIFLDIRMPELSGIEFVNSLQAAPKIIFTTAFREYAIDGFDLNAIDYLLKPVRFERFMKALNKAFPRRIPEQIGSTPPENNHSIQHIFLRVDRKLTKIPLSEILYIESARDYVKVFTKDKSYISRQTISSIEAALKTNEFVRIHRSYIISVSKIKSFTHELVEIGNKELPIGRLYRNSLVQMKG